MGTSYLIFVSGQDNNPLSPSHLSSFSGATIKWLHPDKAAEIEIYDALSADIFKSLQNECDKDAIDVFQISAEHRRKKLLLADMDATIVEGETLDDLAGQIGLKGKIAEITDRAMRGEIDFKSALTERVAMLKDLPTSALEKTLNLITINKGAADVVRVMRTHRAECYLVSGGFTYFTAAIAKACGFNGHHGNELVIKGDVLAGEIIPPILDKDAKRAFLQHYATKSGLLAAETMAVGDGANDIPMLRAAGTGVGYHPKPLVKEAVPNHIIHTDLTSLLYIQGYTWQDIAA